MTGRHSMPDATPLMNGKRLYHNVARTITELIEDGVYAPGSRLPGERHLAEQFGVSRVTVRQALVALQALGKLDIRTGSGAYVLDEVKHAPGKLPDVSPFEVTEARSLFESEVAALAAMQIDDETLARLEGCIETMTRGDAEDETAAEQADRDFHLTIAAASGNSAALHIVELLWRMRTELPQVKQVYDAVCQDDASLRGGEHEEILVALRARSPAAARGAMRKHFTRLLESMLDVTEEQAVAQIRQQALESRQRFLKTAKI